MTEQSFWGGIGTDSYNILLVLHLASMVAAFGSTLLFPVMMRLANAEGGEAGRRLVDLTKTVTERIFVPGIIATAVFGVLLALDSDTAYELSEPWISAAFAIVLLLAAMSYLVLRPAQQRLSDALGKGSEGAADVRSSKATVAVLTGIIHLGLIGMIALMVWKPGEA